MNSQRPAGSVTYCNSGRVVLVSGGAGGIGRAICAAFARSGAAVVSCDVSQPDPEQRVPDVTYLQGNVACESDCASVVEQTIVRHGALDVLVNNAAIQPPSSYQPLDLLAAESWQRMLDVNLSGYTFLAKHAVRQMLEQVSGVIVNISSAQGHRTARQVPAYGPIKAANLMQARQWGVEYARRGVRVVSVSPGAINTPLVRASLDVQGGGEQLASRHPLGRIGDPQEVAAAVLWLCSAAASFVTATDLAVDGGLGAFGAFADPYPPSS